MINVQTALDSVIRPDRQRDRTNMLYESLDINFT